MIDVFFEEIILLLSASACIEKFSITKKKISSSDGYIRIKTTLTNKDFLELSLYCQIKYLTIDVIDYRFHWQNKDGLLVKRWDNCKHYPEVENFPYHVHVGDDSIVEPGTKIEVVKILSEIERVLGSSE